ncbi:hypothetical protein AJ80_07303 [Polytolypa hystricis UAMH7299]|uniref:SUN domain-containing protein n=1 Tax=Polytolypa hystricis (strain UAMH7299) TaxID=1447883 RepID=A0A2B7XR97_POLH7|nr:hypothetical protein AJ80_07303 [Polytolypa hystricis UAMH7299]
MKTFTIASQASALLLFLSSVAEAGKHGHFAGRSAKHQHFHRDASPSPMEGEGVMVAVESVLDRRGGQCEFPSDAGLVAVTPNEQNAGWAMSPDQPCKPGNYCPYACPAGEVMAQWDPDATSYTYPASMNGGLYCDQSGKIQKPFPNKPYCVDASGPLNVMNKASGHVAFCQTVLPGNEAMLIPTAVESSAQLAVPNPSYWCSTAAHYYINPPGTDCETACVWGTKENPWGNWSPYVAGANQDSNGQSFVKIGWNPIYLEPATPFRNERPKFGVKIECEGCNGLPCEIDPSVNDVNEVTGSGTNGAGGASFCVVTVPKGSSANIVVFDVGGSKDGGNQGKDKEDEEEAEPTPSPEPSEEPTTSSEPPPEPTTSSSSSTPPPPPPPPTTSSSSTSTSSSTSKSASKITVSAPLVFAEKPSMTYSQPNNATSTSQRGTGSGPTFKPTEATTDGPSPTPTGAASATALSIMSLTLSFVIVSIFTSF